MLRQLMHSKVVWRRNVVVRLAFSKTVSTYDSRTGHTKHIKIKDSYREIECLQKVQPAVLPVYFLTFCVSDSETRLLLEG